MSLLRQTCALFGVQTSFYNDQGKLTLPSEETLKNILQLLSGESVETEKDLDRLRNSLNLHQTKLPEVIIAWDGLPSSFKIRVDEKNRTRKLSARVQFDEEFRVFTWDLEKFSFYKSKDNQRVFTLTWDLGSLKSFPYGYHEVRFEFGKIISSALIIAAPRKPVNRTTKKNWGLFSPLYAIKSDQDWGIGSLAELEKVQEFLAQRGGEFLGTLPLLAPSKNKDHFEASPYSPSTRLFWNEIYLDIPRICEQMSSSLLSKSYEQSSVLQKLKESRYVDYDAVYALKRQFLKPLSDEFFRKGHDQDPEFLHYLKENPEVHAYAEFCGDQNFNTFVQYQFHRQLQHLFQRSKKKEIASLYLDYPVGVSSQGFDAHHFSESFIKKSSIGAPPDTFFQEGQSWGILPLHPVRMRSQNYSYFIKSLRNHFRYSSLLRLDHVMSLHRLYIIPDGNSAKEGAYVKYPFEHLYAILCLESYRFGAEIIGEDLGTVSPVVREKLTEHEFQRMWIFELEYNKEPALSMKELPKNSLASLNTHDMDPFFKFWSEPKIEQDEIFNRWLKYLGFSPKSDVSKSEVLSRLTQKIAASDAHIFLMNLEDLLGETEPQNTPGVSTDKTWRKKNSLKIEEWTHHQPLLKLLNQVNEVRSK